MTDDTERPSKLRDRAPFRWFFQEDFYRGLTGNIIATVIVFLYLRGAGYIMTPTGAQVVSGVGHVLVNLSFFPCILWAMFFVPFRTPTRYADLPRRRLLLWRVLWVLDMVWLSLCYFHFMGGALNGVWPFNQPGWESPVRR